jgi:tetratricopeptide (TPR) repeat protein
MFVFFVRGAVYTDCEQCSLEKQGDNLYGQRDYCQSVNCWNRALTAEPGNIQLMEKIGTGFLRIGKIRQAEAMFEKALLSDFDDVALHIELLRISLLKNDLAGAEKRCAVLKTMTVSHPEVDILQGDLLILSDQPEKAEAFYRKALNSTRGSGRIFLKLATCLMALGKKVEAYQLFAVADKVADRSPSLLLQMSDFFLVADDPEKAEAYLREAVGLEPGALDLKNRLAQFYLSTGKPEKAESILKALVDADPQNVEFNLLLADLYISLNRMEPAWKIISDMAEFIREPIADYELLQGKYWLYKGHSVYAATYLKTAVTLVPGFASAHYLLGVAYLLGGQNRLAENSFEQALLMEPRQSRSTLLMAVLEYKKDNHRLSLEYLNCLLAEEPENYKAHMMKGLNLMAGKEYEQAILALGAAYALNPERVFPLYFIGMAWELSGKEANAREFYRLVLDKEPERADALYRYTMLLIQNHKPERAEKVLEEFLGAFPENPFINYVAAQIASGTGNHAGAEHYFKQAISLNSTLGYAYIKLAELYGRQGEMEKKFDILNLCITNIPLYKDGWIGLAGHLVRNRKTEAALEVMKKAEKKLPQSPEILANLAWLYVQTGSELDLALDCARRAYSKSPDNDAIADTLAWVYCKKGAYAQAAWILSDLEKRLPDNGMVLYHYGITLYKQGKISQAVERLRSAIAEPLSAQDQATIKAVLFELERLASDGVPLDNAF